MRLWLAPLLVWDIIRFVVLLSTTALTSILIRPKGLTWFRNIAYYAVRLLTSSRAIPELRKTRQQTVDVYIPFVKQRGLPEQITHLEDGAKFVWLGSPKAENVILYFHGGAYLRSAGKAHFVIAQDLVDEAKKQNKSLAVALLQYGLVPQHRYPTQLRQAVTGLRYILDDLAVPLHKIIVAGDSAGGNLALGLLAHLKHPHPEIPAIKTQADEPPRRLNGVFLSSPWLSFSNESHSWKTNANKDILTSQVLAKATREFVDATAFDGYNEPFRADAQWWSDLPVDEIKVSFGSCEVFADDVREFAARLKVGNSRVESVEVEYEVHCQSLVDTTFTGRVEQSGELLRGWVSQALKK